jgi:hypothetical protein
MSFVSDNRDLVLERFSRFAGSGEQDECWIWRGALCRTKDMSGMYGQLNVKQHKLRPSRVSYELFVGQIPQGMFVLHKCDTPPCTNPNHLFLGTAKDNTTDMISKGRHFLKRGEDHPFTKDQVLAWIGPKPGERKGEKNANSKLTERDVVEMRRLRAAGNAYGVVGAAKGISQQYARKVCCGERWPHVSENY